VAYCQADLSEPEGVEWLMAFARQMVGDPDVVVNNAVVRPDGAISDRSTGAACDAREGLRPHHQLDVVLWTTRRTQSCRYVTTKTGIVA